MALLEWEVSNYLLITYYDAFSFNVFVLPGSLFASGLFHQYHLMTYVEDEGWIPRSTFQLDDLYVGIQERRKAKKHSIPPSC